MFQKSHMNNLFIKKIVYISTQIFLRNFDDSPVIKLCTSVYKLARKYTVLYSLARYLLKLHYKDKLELQSIFLNIKLRLIAFSADVNCNYIKCFGIYQQLILLYFPLYSPFPVSKRAREHTNYFFFVLRSASTPESKSI